MMFLGLVEDSEKLYERACKLNPLHTDKYLSYGSNIYFELGNYKKAIELGKKLNEKDVWVDFPAYMAAAYFHLNDFANMHEQWNRFLAQFANSIEKTSTINESHALQWQIKINPYKNKTNLQPFWDFIADQKGLKAKAEPAEKLSPTYSFLEKGDLWEISFNGKTALFKNAKGFGDIAQLIARPEEEIHCSELMDNYSFQENGIEIIDQQAKGNYRKRILEIQSDIGEAEHVNDFHTVDRLQEEYDELLDHLSSATGIGGKTRTTASTVDKVRSAVTWRIRSSIKNMEKIHPLLAKHFSKSIKTGIFCSYKPEFPIDWET